MVRSHPMLLALPALSIVLAGCGAERPPGTAAAEASRVAGSRPAGCPNPTEERVRAVARADERLQPGVLPKGFTRISGDEANPGSGQELTYAQPGVPDGPRVQLSRRISSEPAEQFIGPEGSSRQQIRGHAGVMAESGPSSAFTTAAWHETPDVVIVVSTYRLGQSETLRVAEGVLYEPGRAGDTVAVMPPDAPPECRMLPPHALSRAEFTARFPTGNAQTKLVRLTQITQSPQWASSCLMQPCSEGLLAWVALRQGPPGSFPHSCPPGAPPESCAGSWDLTVSAATSQGPGYGNAIGNGEPPTDFFVWEDLAP